MDERLSKTLDHPYRPTPARRRTLSNRPVAKARGQSNKIADRTTQMTPAFSCQQFSETIEIQEDIYENLNGRGRLLHASSCQQISRTKKIMSHNDWKELRMMSFSDRPIARLCKTCGQFHSPTDSHLYDYHAPINDDLTCEICLQPLVDPVDTKCSHTFCARCIKNFLKLQNVCPLDRNRLTAMDLQPASVIIRRLLDKLQVVCPNVDYCEEVLNRCDLEAHLTYRCLGAVVKCDRSDAGCKFQGPRSAMESHQWECEYQDEQDQSYVAEIEEREITRISITRGRYDLGMSIIGGCDTPLVAITVQEVFANGLIDRDDRLRPGDQLLEVNGVDLTQATHHQAKRALNQILPAIQLTVYRDKSARNQPIEKEDIIRVTLNKEPGRQLGIKLVGKRGVSGVYIMDLIPGSVAYMDGQLQIDDRILEVNSDDLSIKSQEHAANHIQAAHGKIQFVISRRSQPRKPSLIQEHPELSGSTDSIDSCHKPKIEEPSRREKTIVITKNKGESLGLSVAGGLQSQRGDTPLYVMNTSPSGPSHRSGVKKGDILVSVNGAKIQGLGHDDAVRILKLKASHKKVELKLLSMTETADGLQNFIPSWKYWLSLPRNYYLEHEIKLHPAAPEGFGFTLVGGRSCKHGDQPIFVKSVSEESEAWKKDIKCGDILTSINGYSTDNLSNAEATSLLKRSATKVTLKLIRWPGTIV